MFGEVCPTTDIVEMFQLIDHSIQNFQFIGLVMVSFCSSWSLYLSTYSPILTRSLHHATSFSSEPACYFLLRHVSANEAPALYSGLSHPAKVRTQLIALLFGLLAAYLFVHCWCLFCQSGATALTSGERSGSFGTWVWRGNGSDTRRAPAFTEEIDTNVYGAAAENAQPPTSMRVPACPFPWISGNKSVNQSINQRAFEYITCKSLSQHLCFA